MSKRRGRQHLKRQPPKPPRQRKPRPAKGIDFYEMALTTSHADHEVLLRRAAEVEEITPDVFELCSRLLWITKQDVNCLGVAAPQVNVGKRIITVKDDEGFVSVWLNPEFEPAEGAMRISEYEGCFSLPNEKARVERWSGVVVRGKAPTGEPMEQAFAGRTARAVQHEIDHLNGVLISDHAGLEPVHGDVIATGEGVEEHFAKLRAEADARG